MSQTVYQAVLTAPGTVLWAVVGAGALLVPVVMLAWGAARGFAVDLSSHPRPFRTRLLVAAKASLAIPAAVAAGTLLLEGGWWSMGSPLAELGPGALVLGLTLWFALSAWARVSEAVRFVAAGARQSRADSRRFARVFRALKDADPFRAEQEAALCLNPRGAEDAVSQDARDARLRLWARAEDFEARTALCLAPVDLACRVLEPRAAPEELMEILGDEARAEADRRLRPDEPESARSARERLGERASSLARRRSLRLALWRAFAIRREILGDRLEGAADFVYALKSRLRPVPPSEGSGRDIPGHGAEGVAP